MNRIDTNNITFKNKTNNKNQSNHEINLKANECDKTLNHLDALLSNLQGISSDEKKLLERIVKTVTEDLSNNTDNKSIELKNISDKLKLMSLKSLTTMIESFIVGYNSHASNMEEKNINERIINDKQNTKSNPHNSTHFNLKAAELAMSFLVSQIQEKKEGIKNINHAISCSIANTYYKCVTGEVHETWGKYSIYRAYQVGMFIQGKDCFRLIDKHNRQKTKHHLTNIKKKHIYTITHKCFMGFIGV